MKIEISEIEIPISCNEEKTIKDIAAKIKQLFKQSRISASVTILE